MAQLFVLAVRILASALQILELVQAIRAIVDSLQNDKSPTSLLGRVTATETAVAGLVVNVANVRGDIATHDAKLDDYYALIIGAIGTPTQVTQAPEWWQAPPTPPDTDSIANAIWNFASANGYTPGYP